MSVVNWDSRDVILSIRAKVELIYILVVSLESWDKTDFSWVNWLLYIQENGVSSLKENRLFKYKHTASLDKFHV